MKSRRHTFSVFALAAAVTSAFLLGACGQTGELYMPDTWSTKPPPPPREPRLKKKPQQTAEGTSASETQKTDKGN
ncbi:LPS translocon maturation chaperone LptM [Oxalobacter vibrioformis]|uniref:LPS translocon maturation chaperone LptM n=1 Tax=Oxalobacter vibrioformis TaxID=933080 RepID=UPI0038CD5C7D